MVINDYAYECRKLNILVSNKNNDITYHSTDINNNNKTINRNPTKKKEKEKRSVLSTCDQFSHTKATT